MIDASLRSLTRDLLLDDGDLHARARLLVERVRIGDLHEDRLRLAAFLDEEAARLALGPDAPSGGDLDAVDLVLGLKGYGPDAFVRAAIAVAVRFLEPTPTEQVNALQAWLACPCEDHARAVRGAARLAELGEWEPRHIGGPILVAKLATPRPWSRASGCTPYSDGLRIGFRCRVDSWRRGRYTTRAGSDDEVRDEVVRALLPWALGR